MPEGKGYGKKKDKKDKKDTHGAAVSAVARSTPGGKGHGAAVKAVAKKKR